MLVPHLLLVISTPFVRCKESNFASYIALQMTSKSGSTVLHPVTLRSKSEIWINNNVNSDIHTRICSTCGQGFTRNSSVVWHNNSLHCGHAIIVRPYDYIIGRLRGEFLPADPALYRRDHKNRRKSLGPWIPISY
jgi:hypothetical protein